MNETSLSAAGLMNRYKCLVLTAAMAALSLPCTAQSLKERAGFGGMMTAADQTAILFSEIELCEQRVPDFRAQAASHLVRIRATSRFKELAKSPEYVRVLPEARAFVQERTSLQDMPALCRNTLEWIKQPAP